MADIGVTTQRRGRPPRSESDISSVDRLPLGTHGVGRVFRSTRLTPCGWALVSPEVRARIADRLAAGRGSV